MQTNSIDIPVVEDASHASSVYGGIIIYRPDEGGSLTSSKIKLGSLNLKLNKLAGLAYVSSELLEDSPISIEPLLNKSFGEAIGFQIDDDIINGNGANQCLGILNAPSLVSVGKETGQATDTIVTKNLVKMWSRFRSRSQNNAIWVANNDAFPQLATLTQEVGTGGSAAGLIQMATNGVTGSPMMTLMGRQLFLTENCQTIGDKGDIILADMGQYLVGEKAGGQIRAASSIHLKFDTDQTAFRFIVRIDGKPWEVSALTPKYSTSTLSSFVTLGAR
jgi:HK97 family phage major capsid protein